MIKADRPRPLHPFGRIGPLLDIVTGWFIRERRTIDAAALNGFGRSAMQDKCTVRTWRWFDVVRE